jgi:hypothetical protein
VKYLTLLLPELSFNISFNFLSCNSHVSFQVLISETLPIFFTLKFFVKLNSFCRDKLLSNADDIEKSIFCYQVTIHLSYRVTQYCKQCRLPHKTYRLAANWEPLVWSFKTLNCSVLMASGFNICSFCLYAATAVFATNNLESFSTGRDATAISHRHYFRRKKFRLCVADWILAHGAEHRP